MLRFFILLFLGVYAYLTLNENSNFSRRPKNNKSKFFTRNKLPGNYVLHPELLVVVCLRWFLSDFWQYA